MARIARSSIHTPFVHIMAQGINKEYIFYKEKYMSEYIKLLKIINSDFNIQIMAYCMMGNHVHILVYAPDKLELGKFMQKVNSIYSLYYNSHENRVGVVFRNRYRAEGVDNIKYLINCINYIHNNPVNAGIVNNCRNYKYSSYREYLSNTGVTKSKIFSQTFGKGEAFLNIFQRDSQVLYIDTAEDRNAMVSHYMDIAIKDFAKRNNISSEKIRENDILFNKLISEFKSFRKFNYNDIQKYFNLSDWEIKKIRFRT